MPSQKPHKGDITNVNKIIMNEGGPWQQDRFGPNLGYALTCTFVSHPQFRGRDGHTSLVTAYDETTGEVETLNSRYRIV